MEAQSKSQVRTPNHSLRDIIINFWHWNVKLSPIFLRNRLQYINRFNVESKIISKNTHSWGKVLSATKSSKRLCIQGRYLMAYLLGKLGLFRKMAGGYKMKGLILNKKRWKESKLQKLEGMVDQTQIHE